MMLQEDAIGNIMLLTIYNLFLLAMGLYGYFFGGSLAAVVTSSLAVFFLAICNGMRQVVHDALLRLVSAIVITILSLLFSFFLFKLVLYPKLFPTAILAVTTACILLVEIYTRWKRTNQTWSAFSEEHCDESEFLDR